MSNEDLRSRLGRVRALLEELEAAEKAHLAAGALNEKRAIEHRLISAFTRGTLAYSCPRSPGGPLPVVELRLDHRPHVKEVGGALVTGSMCADGRVYYEGYSFTWGGRGETFTGVETEQENEK